jgi:hypothetical protein
VLEGLISGWVILVLVVCFKHMLNKICILIAILLVLMTLATVLVMGIAIPNTYASGITHEQYKEMVGTSSYAATNATVNAYSLVLYNGYEGSQYLLKCSIIFNIALFFCCALNCVLVAMRMRSSPKQSPMAEAPTGSK